MKFNLWKYKHALLLFLLILSLSHLPFAYSDDIDSSSVSDDTTDTSVPDPGQITFREQIGQHDESVDPFTGVLTIKNTDLELPANGGMKVSIIRTYDSSRVTQSTLIKGTLGYGWDIHFGRVHKVTKGISIELQDGTTSIAYRSTSSSNTYVTKDFWSLSYPSSPSTSNPPILKLADGTVITFGAKYTSGAGTLFYATEIKKNNNAIEISYTSYDSGYLPVESVKYYTGETEKEIDFSYTYTTKGYFLSTISWGDATDTKSISYSTDDEKTLHSVTFPENEIIYYDYTSQTISSHSERLLLSKEGSITGGITFYTFDTFYKNCGFNTAKAQGSVASKSYSDQNGTAYTTYTYSEESDGDYTDVVETFTDLEGYTHTKTTEYKFYGFASDYSGSTCYKYGLTQSESTTYSSDDSDDTHTENITYDWGSLDSAISSTNYSVLCACSQGEVDVPSLVAKTITRDGTEYSTTYDDYDSYGNPGTIVESGYAVSTDSHVDSMSASKTTSNTYWTDTDKNMVKNFIQQSVISANDDSFTTTYSYSTDSSSYGDVSSVSKYGITTSYGYNDYGDISSITDARGNTTTYSWTNGSVSQIVSPLSITRTREINWDGTVASETDGRGYTTSYTYDNDMRLVQTTPPLGNPTTVTYNNNDGTLVSKTVTKGNFSTISSFDGSGNVYSQLDSLGNESTTYCWPDGKTFESSSNTGDTTSYDVFGRVTSIVHQDDTEIDYTYDGDDHITITDENDNDTNQYFSYWGNPDDKLLTKIENAKNEDIYYSYNVLGSLTGTYRGGVTRSFSYNSNNFLVTAVNPETGTTTYSHYANGLLHHKIENSGGDIDYNIVYGNGLGVAHQGSSRITTYTYDDDDRLTSVTSGDYSKEYGYDYAGNLTNISNDDVAVTQKFDANNRITRKTSSFLNTKKSVTYAYDDNGNISVVGYPSGLSVSYNYNDYNQVTSVTGFGGSITDISYSSTAPYIGLMTGYNRSNGQTVSFGYNDRRLLTSSGPSALRLGYSYSDRGNMETLSRTGKTTQRFGYDSLNRITSASGAWGSGSYAYNSAGNRTSKTLGNETTDYTYSDNLVSAETDRNYAYSRGNVTELGSYVLSYDPFNNLLTSKKGSTLVGTYLYDAEDNRVYKKTPSGKTSYFYGQSNNVLTEVSSGSPTSNYIYLNNTLVARVNSSAQGTVAPWLILLLGN